jgi:hypothetical protein
MVDDLLAGGDQQPSAARVQGAAHSKHGPAVCQSTVSDVQLHRIAGVGSPLQLKKLTGCLIHGYHASSFIALVR